MLKPIQFHSQPRQRAVEIQDVSPNGMLATELESRETSRSQRAPKPPLLASLIASQAPSHFRAIHKSKMTIPIAFATPSLVPVSSTGWTKGQGRDPSPRSSPHSYLAGRGSLRSGTVTPGRRFVPSSLRVCLPLLHQVEERGGERRAPPLLGPLPTRTSRGECYWPTRFIVSTCPSASRRSFRFR